MNAIDSLDLNVRSELVTAARQFYQQGWMVGTAGNLSARLPDGSFWITISGRSKGELTINDFIRVTSEGHVLEQLTPGTKPSAETIIHQVIYSLFPDVQACYHVHSIEANLAAHLVTGDALPLPPLEMLKGLGIWDDNPTCTMPIFANHPQVTDIATAIQQQFQQHPPQIPALLIRDHGVTVWATSTETARNAIELVNYIFRYMVAARQTGM
jgi:methylthioribulose-1-phosphate dehydratase